MPEPTYKTVDSFDNAMGALVQQSPDVTKVKPSTVVTHSPLIGAPQTFIIQTFRHRENGDTIFIQYIEAGSTIRLAISPAAAKVIASQRDALTGKVRRKIAKQQAQARKAQGIQPGFLKVKKAQS